MCVRVCTLCDRNKPSNICDPIDTVGTTIAKQSRYTLSFSEVQGCISLSLSAHQRIKVVFYSPSALQFMMHYSEVLLVSVLSFLTSSKDFFL